MNFMLDILGVKPVREFMILYDNGNFCFEEMRFPLKRRKIPLSRNTQKTSGVWSATWLHSTLLHLHVFSLPIEHKGIRLWCKKRAVSHVQWLWFIRVHLNLQSRHQPDFLHLHGKSDMILVWAGRCFLLPRKWRAHFWILKVDRYDRFAEILETIAGSKCQTIWVEYGWL